MRDRKERLNAAQLALLGDFSVGSETRQLARRELTALSRYLSRFEYRLAYTAFDGDHFSLTSLMKRYCLRHDIVPVNPESVLGYRDTVQARLSKKGVLWDDLAVLRRCDELLVFTDCPADAEGASALAEGVLIEMCFFLLAHPSRSVKFVPLAPLVTGSDPDPVPLAATATDVLRALGHAAADEIREFLGGDGLEITRRLPPVTYVIMDPLDSKYMDWVRPYALGEQQTVAVVPGLAIEFGDVAAVRTAELGCLFVSWIALMRLASAVWEFEPMSPASRGSNTVEILRGAWLRQSDEDSIATRRWSDLRIPKALLGDSWPITRIERPRDVIGGDKS